MHEGRVTDFIVTPEGKAISGVAIATYVIPTIPGLQTAQFIQHNIARVTVNVVADAVSYPDICKRLRQRLREFVGNEIDIDMHCVDHIATAESGKFRFIESCLPPETILKAANSRYT